MSQEISSPPGVCLPIPCPLLIPFSFLYPFPIPLLRPLRYSHPGLSSLPFPGPFLTTLRVFLSLAVINVIAIAKTALPTGHHTGICPVLILINLIDDLNPNLSFNWQAGIGLIKPAVWSLNLCHAMIGTLPRETFASAYNPSQAGCLWISALNLIPECTVG
jgi:hypothetical protein